MKEATGDLNMTVVVVLIVAVLVAFFSMTIAPMVLHNIKNEANCSDAICSCTAAEKENGICSCRYIDKKTHKVTNLSCPYKG